MKSSVVESAMCHKMWGTWSCKNLMKARLGCQSVKSVRWVVKKAPIQTEVIKDTWGAIKVISNYSILREAPERRISRGYCKGGRPSGMYICIYWVRGPI